MVYMRPLFGLGWNSVDKVLVWAGVECGGVGWGYVLLILGVCRVSSCKGPTSWRAGSAGRQTMHQEHMIRGFPNLGIPFGAPL